MTAARIRAQFPTSDGFGDQLKGCCRPPFVWASYNISRYIGRHSSRENNVPYCSHYSSSNTVPSTYTYAQPCRRPTSYTSVGEHSCQDWVIMSGPGKFPRVESLLNLQRHFFTAWNGLWRQRERPKDTQTQIFLPGNRHCLFRRAVRSYQRTPKHR